MTQTAKYGNFDEISSVWVFSAGADFEVVRCGFGLVWCGLVECGAELAMPRALVWCRLCLVFLPGRVPLLID